MEILVSFIVLAIVALPLLSLFTACSAGIIHAGHKTAAVNLCREKMEVIKANGYSYYIDRIRGSPEGVYVETEEPAGTEVFFRREARLQLANLLLEGEESGIPVIAISVQVAWRDRNAEHAVKMESIMARR